MPPVDISCGLPFSSEVVCSVSMAIWCVVGGGGVRERRDRESTTEPPPSSSSVRPSVVCM